MGGKSRGGGNTQPPSPEGHFLLCFFLNSLNIWCLFSSATPPEDSAPHPGKNPGSTLFNLLRITNENKTVHSYVFKIPLLTCFNR